MKKLLILLFTSSLFVNIIKNPKIILTGITVTCSFISKSQTFLTKAQADTLYKKRSYSPYIFGATVDGTNYLWVDSLHFYEVPVTVWGQVQMKPDFKGVAFNALQSQLIDDVGLVYFEQQALSISGNTISIKTGSVTINSISLPAITSSVVTNALGFTPLSNTYTPIDNSITNEIQTLSGSGTNTLVLSGGGNFIIPAPVLTSTQVINGLGFTPLSNTYTPIDNSITNELQTLSGSGTNTLNLSGGGGTYVLPVTTLSASQVTTALNYVPLSNTYTPIDNSITNEIQTPSITSGVLSLSGTTVTAVAYTVNVPVSAPTHSVINTAYQPSVTKATKVSISASLVETLSLTAGQSGVVLLQFSPDGSNWTTYARTPSSNQGSLTVGLNTSQGSGGQLCVELPVGYYWRWTSTGTGTFTLTDIFETPIN